MLTKKGSSSKGETATSGNLATQGSHDLTTMQKPLTSAGKGTKTRITIKYDVGFNNSLYIRGKGANLSWDRGIPLKNVKHDEWVWETDAAFPNGEFKVLINDRTYETGNNHPLNCGATIQYSPHF
jgi:hypothetical protein